MLERLLKFVWARLQHWTIHISPSSRTGESGDCLPWSSNEGHDELKRWRFSRRYSCKDNIDSFRNVIKKSIRACRKIVGCSSCTTKRKKRGKKRYEDIDLCVVCSATDRLQAQDSYFFGKND